MDPNSIDCDGGDKITSYIIGTLSKKYDECKTNGERQILLSTLLGWYMNKKSHLDFVIYNEKEHSKM
jgi:hypothetical protein